MNRKLALGVGLLAATTALGISPAFAASVYSPDGGTHVWTSGGGKDLHVADTAADSKSVHGNYQLTNGRSGSVANSGGSGTVEVRRVTDTLSMSRIQACTNGNWGVQPDNCSGWVG